MEFFGRQDELDLLKQAWQACLAGRPQVVALVGEPRLGKTRVVQEFYHWLNTQLDPGNYWPDSLPRTDDSLQVNPDFPEPSESPGLPPWLWWGVRWGKPDQHNSAQAVPCAVLAYEPHLRPHIAVVHRHVKRKKLEREAWIGVGKTALNLATAGTAGPAIEAFERLQDWWRLRGQYAPVQGGVSRETDSFTKDEFQRLLQALLAAVKTDVVVPGGLPLVIVLDDVHWADTASLAFVHRLLRLAAESSHGVGARLLIIATVWEREWNKQVANGRAEIADGAPPETFFQAVHRARSSTPDERGIVLSAHRVGPIAGPLEDAISEDLPGLTQSQRSLIARRSGGSPGLLVELLIKLKRRSRHLFDRSDPTLSLTKRGEQAVAAMTVDYYTIVEERLQDLDSAEALALRVASHIGLNYSRVFVQQLLMSTAEIPHDGLSALDVAAALRRADQPLAIVQPTFDGIDEFRLPIYQEVLARQYDESTDLRVQVEERAKRLMVSWLEKPSARDISFSERWGVLAFGIRMYLNGGDLRERRDDQLQLLRLIGELNSWQFARYGAGLHQDLIRVWFTQWESRSAVDTHEVGRSRLDDILTTAIRHSMLTEAAALAQACLDCCDQQAIDPERDAWAVRLLHASGTIQKEAGRPEESLGWFEAYLRGADHMLAVWGVSAEREHDRWIALARVGDSLLAAGRVEEALARYRQALEQGERLVVAHPERAKWMTELATSQQYVGEALQQLSRFDEAIIQFRLAMQTFEQAGNMAEDADKYDPRYGHYAISERLGELLLKVGRPQEALDVLATVPTLYRDHTLGIPATANARLPLLCAQYESIEAFVALGRTEEAIAAALATLEIVRSDLHVQPRRQSDAFFCERVAEALMGFGRISEAIEAQRLAIHLRQLSLDAGADHRGTSVHLALGRFTLAQYLSQAGQIPEATVELEALCTSKDNLPPDLLPPTWAAMAILGGAALSQGKVQKSIEQWVALRDSTRRVYLAGQAGEVVLTYLACSWLGITTGLVTLALWKYTVANADNGLRVVEEFETRFPKEGIAVIRNGLEAARARARNALTAKD